MPEARGQGSWVLGLAGLSVAKSLDKLPIWFLFGS